jgi:hypothetical protein
MRHQEATDGQAAYNVMLLSRLACWLLRAASMLDQTAARVRGAVSLVRAAPRLVASG